MRMQRWVWVAVGLAGCQEVIDLDPIDERPPIEARVRPGPITGGTLAITEDGIAVAADPDRDLVHVVSVQDRRVLHTIELAAGDAPGRVVPGSDGLAHVVLRGAGSVATIDLAEGTVVARRAVCADPRGIAFDGGDETLHVACADGTMVHLPESGDVEIARSVLAPDLRDVVLVGGRRYASQFRAATLVRDDGQTLRLAEGSTGEQPHVAWAMREDRGRVVMLHQFAEDDPIPIGPSTEDLGLTGGVPYGGSGGSCGTAIVGAAVSLIDDDEMITMRLPQAKLAVDVALSHDDGDLVAVAVPGAPAGEPTVVLTMGVSQGFFGCTAAIPSRVVDHQVTSVAFDPADRLVMQSREPAALLVQWDPPLGTIDVIELPGEPRFDSAHEIFHRATQSGLSCASCHPEGTDDGFVWTFETLGKRRTQALDAGLGETAPFHWDGEMGDLDVLVEEVLAHRMGGLRQSQPRRESLARWLFDREIRPAATGRDDPGLVEQGAARFADLGCGTCHLGATLGGKTSAPIDGKDLQVPSLLRVSLRPPFMHDGRADTLEDAVRDMLVATTDAGEPAQDDVDAIAAYLRTL